MQHSNRTLKSMEELFRIEDHPMDDDHIIAEANLKSPVPNYAEIYGLSYKQVEHILVRYEEKAKQKAAKMSLSELDFNTMPPFTLHIIEKGYLTRACYHLKIE